MTEDELLDKLGVDKCKIIGCLHMPLGWMSATALKNSMVCREHLPEEIETFQQLKNWIKNRNKEIRRDRKRSFK